MTDQELPEGFFSRLEVSKESGMGCFEILPPDAEAMPRDKEEWRKAMEIQSETRRSRPMENKSDAETRQIADLRSRISDYLRGGGLFNPELAQHHAVRDLILDIDRVLSARLTSPSVEEVIELARVKWPGKHNHFSLEFDDCQWWKSTHLTVTDCGQYETPVLCSMTYPTLPELAAKLRSE